MCLRVTGPLRAMKCPSSEPVSTMVPTPLQRDLGQGVVTQVAQRSAGVGQLGAAQVDLVVRHHPDELEDLLPARDEARAQRVVHAEGLAARRGSPTRRGIAGAAPGCSESAGCRRRRRSGVVSL